MANNAAQGYDPLAWLDAFSNARPAPDPMAWLDNSVPPPAPASQPVYTPQGTPADFPGMESDQSGLDAMGQPLAPEAPSAGPPIGSVADMPEADMPDFGGGPSDLGLVSHRGGPLSHEGGYGGTVGQNLGWLLGLGLLGGGAAASRIAGEYGRAYDTAERMAEAKAYRAAQIAQKQAELEEQKRNHDALLDDKQKARQQAWDLAQQKGKQTDMSTLIRAWDTAAKTYGMDPSTVGGQFTLGLQDYITHTVAATKAVSNGTAPPPTPDGIMPTPTQADAEAAVDTETQGIPLYGAGSSLGLGVSRQANIEANTAATNARIPGYVADSYVKQNTAGDKVAQSRLGTFEKKVDIAGKQQDIGESRKLFPGKVRAQELSNQKADLERWILRNNTIPLNNARITHQEQVNTGTVPEGSTGGTKMLPIPVGANAAIAVKANALRGVDFGVRGCARFVTQTLRDAGVGIKGSENAAELERQIQSVKGVTAISDPSKFQPGDVIFTAGSGPSGRHVMVVASDGKIVGNPGVNGDTRVRTQGGGQNMVAYRINPPKEKAGAKPKKPAQYEIRAAQIAKSNVDPQLFDNLTKIGVAPGPQMKATLDFYVAQGLIDPPGTLRHEYTIKRDQTDAYNNFLAEQKAWRDGRRKWVNGRTVITDGKTKPEPGITPQSLLRDQAAEKKKGKPKSKPTTGVATVDSIFGDVLKK
jgi:hypothetical protein